VCLLELLGSIENRTESGSQHPLITLKSATFSNSAEVLGSSHVQGLCF
jgi:hypothetical protein